MSKKIHSSGKITFFQKYKLPISVLGITLICSIGLFFLEKHLNIFAPNLNAGINRHPLRGECVSIDFPAVMTGGEEYSGTVKLRNTGTETWKPMENGKGIALVIPKYGGGASRWGYTTQWVDTNIASGENFTFGFSVKAPDWFPDGQEVPFVLGLFSPPVTWVSPLCILNITIQKSEQFDVELIKDVPQPVWDANSAKINPLGGGYDAIGNLDFLQSGYFIINGYCNDKMHGKNDTKVERGDHESGGLYMLREDGTFAGLANVCHDTSIWRNPDCFHSNGCHTGMVNFDLGNGRILAALDESMSSYKIHRAPVVYRSTGGESLTKEKVYYVLDGRGSGDPRKEGPGSKMVQYVVVAGGKMIGVETGYVGDEPPDGHDPCRTTEHTIVYELPSFRILKEHGRPSARCAGKEEALYKPRFSVQDLFVAEDEGTEELAARRNFGVYRVENNGDITSEGRLIGPGALIGHTLDSADNSRVAVLWRNSNPSPDTDGAEYVIIVYQATVQGLEKNKTILVPNDVRPEQVAKYSFSQAYFAVAGNYVAYQYGQRIIVEKNGERLTVEPLPTDSDGDVLTPRYVALSSSGKLLVSATYDGITYLPGPQTRDTSGVVFLYQIKEFEPGQEPDEDDDDTGGDGDEDNGIGSIERVQLVKKIYDEAEIPFNSLIVHSAFANSTWAGGHFVITGYCNDSKAHPGIGRFEAGGGYIFDASGKLMTVQNVCYETSERASACQEGGGCYTGVEIHNVNNNLFLRNNFHSPAFPRSPLLYKVLPEKSSAPAVGQLWFYGDKNFEKRQISRQVVRVKNIAYANGIMITNQLSAGAPMTKNGVLPLYKENGFYTVSENGFEEVANPLRRRPCQAQSGQSGLSDSLLVPYFGVGDYFLAEDRRDMDPCNGVSGYFQPSLFRMPSPDEIRNGAIPEKVESFESGYRFLGYAIDPLNPNRVAIYWQENIWKGRNYILAEEMSSQIYEQSYYLQYYVATDEGLIPETGKKRIGKMLMNESHPTAHAFAIYGDYLAYSPCAGVGHPFSIKNPFPEQYYSKCDLVVEKNGKKLPVDLLPEIPETERMYERYGHQWASSLAFSDQGTLLVTTIMEGAQKTQKGPSKQNVYLYKVANQEIGGDGDDSETGDGIPFPPPDDSPPEECALLQGNGCAIQIEAGELQLGEQGAHGCSEDAFCVQCAEGYDWNTETKSCDLKITCEEAGGNKCAFRIGEGEVSLGGPGAYGCTGWEPYCVRCASGKQWNGASCE